MNQPENEAVLRALAVEAGTAHGHALSPRMTSTPAAIMMRYASSVFNYFLPSCPPSLLLLPGPRGAARDAHRHGGDCRDGWAHSPGPGAFAQPVCSMKGGASAFPPLCPSSSSPCCCLITQMWALTTKSCAIATGLNPVALIYMCALGLPACTRKYSHLN